ncbi:MAG TPA: hypothetical protein VJO32_10865 [Ktedonobacteraceae bacterium]|nr:hypothetical protein [Ktedonobacteraceae bacterium]
MHFSPRSKVGILLSAVTILTLVGAFMVTLASHGATTHAASSSNTANYNATSIKGKQVLTSSTLAGGSTKTNRVPTTPLVLTNPHESELGGAKTNAVARKAPAPAVTSTSAVPEGHIVRKFNGISDADQAAANGGALFEVTPPDQGLCVGKDRTLPGNPTVVIESVNDALAEYSTSGKLLHTIISQAGFLGDPNAFSDPRCFYDPQTKAFFFTIISSASFGAANDTFDDVGVFNGSQFALYQFDTSLGGTCFGDQPHVGYDTNNLYLATDQFCNTGYLGALLIAVSKSQLVQEVALPNAVAFGPVSLGGIPILTLQPAISTNVATEYLLNSFPFDQFGNNNSVDNSLGLWHVLNGQNVTKGGPVVLTGQIIRSETYAFPMPAASTGTGATTIVTVGTLNIPVVSEQFLNPDDDRMQQVQVVNDNGTLEMWASLSTALTIKGDPSARDGAAWFKIDVKNQSVAQQGYVAAAGKYLLYPAILHTNEGTTTMVFTITSTTLNPSSAYAVMKSGNTSFGGITIAAVGAGPHLSFALPLSGRTRWGDYSAAALDPNGTNIWQATEYIPPVAHQDPLDNWGTSVFEVAGDN